MMKRKKKDPSLIPKVVGEEEIERIIIRPSCCALSPVPFEHAAAGLASSL